MLYYDMKGYNMKQLTKNQKIGIKLKRRWQNPVERKFLIDSMGKRKPHSHTEEYKKYMSKVKKKWWQDVKKNHPKKYKQICKNIGKSSEGRGKGLIGPKSYGWRGGRYTTERDGYVFVYVPEHPNAKRSGTGGGGYVLEHRLVIEKSLGRYLTNNEEVHHINGKKDDNRIENLELVVKKFHFGEIECPYCQKKFKVK